MKIKNICIRKKEKEKRNKKLLKQISLVQIGIEIIIFVLFYFFLV